MAGWEEELTVILQQLGVEQERPAVRRQLRKPLRHDMSRNEQLSEALSDSSNADADSSADSGAGAQESRETAGEDVEVEEVDVVDKEDGIWMHDLEMMRYEVNSIVNQVIRLMQRGDMDSSLKDDVMIVLRALRRRATVTQQAAKSDEAYLEFASAMLHFCRLVLQLSEVASEE